MFAKASGDICEEEESSVHTISSLQAGLTKEGMPVFGQ